MVLEIITDEGLATFKHGFFTRKGGASSGIFSGLNCGQGSSDQSEIVALNRARVADALDLGPEALASVHQIHSADAIALTEPLAEKPKADAMVTATKGIGLAILTADCQPVLFADTTAGVIGAAHAGWINQLLDDNPHLAGHRLRPLSLAYAAELDPDGERTHDGAAFVAPMGYGLTTTERIAAKYKPGKGYRSLTQIGNQLEALKTRHTRSGSKIVMPSDLQEWDVAVEVGACRPPRLVRGGAGTQPTPSPAERPHPEHAEPAPFDDAG